MEGLVVVDAKVSAEPNDGAVAAGDGVGGISCEQVRMQTSQKLRRWSTTI